MFQNQNNNQTNNFNQDVNAVPVHTMRQDLEKIKHPELEVKTEQIYAPPKRPVNMTEAQKSSPFFNQPVTIEKTSRTALVPEKPPFISQKPAPEPIKVTPQKPLAEGLKKYPERAPEPIKIMPSRTNNEPLEVSRPTFLKEPVRISQPEAEISEESDKKTGAGKSFALVSAVLLIMVVVVAGYYFWLIQNDSAQEVSVVSEPAQVIVPEPEPTPLFSSDKPNVLAIDSSGTSDAIKEALNKEIQAVSEAKTDFPVEFLVEGNDAKPVAFKDFAKLLEIPFSLDLTANLSDNFSLFIYNDQKNTRLGLSIESKDPIALKKLTAIEESNLAGELSPLFFDKSYKLTPGVFGSSNYKDIAVRYFNIISPEELSLDYAIYKNKLLVGTTKMTLRAIIDKQLATDDSALQTSNASTTDMSGNTATKIPESDSASNE